MTTNRAILFSTLGVLTILGAGAVTTSIVNTQAFDSNNSEAQTAIQNNDLDGFKEAIKTSNNSRLQNRLDNLDQAKFDQIRSRYEQSQTVKDAITSKNYEEFKANAPQKLLDRIDTEEKFIKLGEIQTKMDEFQTSIETSVKNDDFTAYSTIMKEQRAYLEENRPTDDSRPSRGNRPELTEDQLKERFDHLKEIYAEEGSLPDRRDMIGKGLIKHGRNRR